MSSMSAAPGAFTKFAESGETVPTLAGLITWAHGLGGAPRGVQMFGRCKIAAQGYAVGDEVQFGSNTVNGATASASVYVDSADVTNVKARISDSYIRVATKAGGTENSITLASWAIFFRAWR